MPPVKLPNGSYAKVTHVGYVYLTPSIKQNNVLCVPSFRYNLISISKFTASNPISAIFTHDSCIFQDQSQKMMIGVAKQHGGLYYFKPSQNSSVVLILFYPLLIYGIVALDKFLFLISIYCLNLLKGCLYQINVTVTYVL